MADDAFAHGFLLVQASSGTRLLHFDAQARLLDGGTDLYPAVAAASTTEYAAAENGAAVDGNGFWLATTFRCCRLPTRRSMCSSCASSISTASS
jgi:hypothetical protein